MKSLLILTTLSLPLGVFAQGNNANPQAQMQTVNYYNNLEMNTDNQATENFPGSGSSDNTNGKVRCKDCDAVKKALAAAHASPKASHHSNFWRMQRWSKKISGRMDVKMKRLFVHHKKFKTTYETCFNWH